MEKKLVFVENSRPVTDSLTVADVFGKRHDNVMKDVRHILSDIDSEWGILNFQETSYVHSQNGQTYSKYVMTEDGFTILVMGYTGKDAMQFKVEYIKEFRQMQIELQGSKIANRPQLPQTYLEALKALVSQVEKNEQLEADKLMLQQCLAEAQPKVTYVDRILESKDTMLITQISKDYGMSGRRLNTILHSEGVQYKLHDQWVLYWQYQNLGYTKSHTHEFTRSSGEKGTKIITEWTQKGRLFIHELLSKRDIIATMDKPRGVSKSADIILMPTK